MISSFLRSTVDVMVNTSLKPLFYYKFAPHKRPDRDTYVTVLTQHLLDQFLGAFEKFEVFPDAHFSKGLNCH